MPLLTRAELQSALGNRNVLAFLAVIRRGEGTADPDGYKRIFGGEELDSFADHPRRVVTKKLKKGGTISSSAAGAYQFLERTWDALVKQYGFADFEPLTQDYAAIALIAGRKALNNVLQGEFQEAVRKCAREWASLPTAPYGQPTLTWAVAIETYRQAGGSFAPAPETQMPIPAILGAIAASAAPLLIQKIPELVGVLSDRDRKSPEQYAEVAGKSLEIITEAVGAVNAQEALDRLQDPEQAEQARAAIREHFYELQELGGGIQAAREFAIDYATRTDVRRVVGQFTFLELLTLLSLPAAYVAGTVAFIWGGLGPEMKAALVTALVIQTVQVAYGFWFGTSFGSMRKDSRTRGDVG